MTTHLCQVIADIPCPTPCTQVIRISTESAFCSGKYWVIWDTGQLGTLAGVSSNEINTTVHLHTIGTSLYVS